jgi:hypothetical protein
MPNLIPIVSPTFRQETALQPLYNNPGGDHGWEGMESVFEEECIFRFDKKLNSSKTDNLVFESRFESGNLMEVSRIGTATYSLIIRPDISTKGHSQWYYFGVKNMKSLTTYTFKIVNLTKRKSLYMKGLQPLMHSIGAGWQRVGNNFQYTKNPEGKDYTLSFQVVLPENHAEKTLNFRHRLLCKSILGNNIDLITITEHVQHPSDLDSRKIVILTARVHPGETNSSWVIQGVLEFLLSNDPKAIYLRKSCIFKIVPMINPDGVILGNYRCNSTGYDLNRHWNVTESSKNDVYEIFKVKEMVMECIKSKKPVSLFCDFHGHNRKHGVFLYGCNNDSRPAFRYHERVFPFVLSNSCPEYIDFRSCQYKVQKSKANTGRITLWRDYHILNSYTLETSFCGTKSEAISFQYTIKNLLDIGTGFGMACFKFHLDAEPKSSLEFCEDINRAKHLKQQILDSYSTNPEQYIPYDTESSDTTSDEEKLRKPKTKSKVPKFKMSRSDSLKERPTKKDADIPKMTAKPALAINSSISRRQKKQIPRGTPVARSTSTRTTEKVELPQAIIEISFTRPRKSKRKPNYFTKSITS